MCLLFYQAYNIIMNIKRYNNNLKSATNVTGEKHSKNTKDFLWTVSEKKKFDFNKINIWEKSEKMNINNTIHWGFFKSFSLPLILYALPISIWAPVIKDINTIYSYSFWLAEDMQVLSPILDGCCTP